MEVIVGASDWEYWVPYEADIGAALAKLRAKSFASGNYYVGRGKYKIQTPSSIEDYNAKMNALGLASGAHSILDMREVADEPGFFKVAPLADPELMELFDTTKPTRAQVTAKSEHLRGLRASWLGTYIVVYEGDEPREIYFAGFSGD
ncbi:MAG: hypothetical protein U0271_38990 [Polyangiaceae bacterium]